MDHATNAEKNLQPVRTKEEARERGRNGGIASGKARRKKRTMKNAINLLLEMPLESNNLTETMKKMSFDEEDMDKKGRPTRKKQWVVLSAPFDSEEEADELVERLAQYGLVAEVVMSE